MLEFPKWFNEMLPRLTCPNCKQKVRRRDIVGEGIRKCMSDNTQTAFFIEYCCSKCGKSISMELQKMTLEEFTMELLDIFTEDIDEMDDISDVPDKKNDSDERASKITQKEVDNARSMVKESSSHYDFMMKIGLTDELLEQYEKEYGQTWGKKKN